LIHNKILDYQRILIIKMVLMLKEWCYFDTKLDIKYKHILLLTLQTILLCGAILRSIFVTQIQTNLTSLLTIFLSHMSLTLLTTLLTTKIQAINHLFYQILCISHGINLCTSWQIKKISIRCQHCLNKTRDVKKIKSINGKKTSQLLHQIMISYFTFHVSSLFPQLIFFIVLS